MRSPKIMIHQIKNLDTSRKDQPGYLYGLPIVIKDLTEVKDVKTTYGSKVFEDYIPSASDFLVERIEKMGGVIIGKTNTPEFGAGSQTFNEVFGYTKNPWNIKYTSGGSSGGTAAALAAGAAWLGTGSDLGGSLRNPARFFKYPNCISALSFLPNHASSWGSPWDCVFFHPT